MSHLSCFSSLCLIHFLFMFCLTHQCLIVHVRISYVSFMSCLSYKCLICLTGVWFMSHLNCPCIIYLIRVLFVSSISDLSYSCLVHVSSKLPIPYWSHPRLVCLIHASFVPSICVIYAPFVSSMPHVGHPGLDWLVAKMTPWVSNPFEQGWMEPTGNKNKRLLSYKTVRKLGRFNTKYNSCHFKTPHFRYYYNCYGEWEQLLFSVLFTLIWYTSQRRLRTSIKTTF